MFPSAESMNHQIDHGNVDHGLAALDECFVTFRQSPVSTQPGERPFHNPSCGQNVKGVQSMAFHNLDDSPIPPRRPIHKVSSVPTVREDEFQPSEPSSQSFHQRLAAVAVLNISGMHNERQDQTQRVNDQMPLTPLDFLARVMTTVPPFSAVLTDWLSMMPADGVGFLPAFRRTWARRRS